MTFYCMTKDGFTEQKEAGPVVPVYFQNGSLYYDVTELADSLGYAWAEGTSRIYKIGTLSNPAPCVTIVGSGRDYELLISCYVEILKDGAFLHKECNLPYQINDGRLLVKTQVLETVFHGAVDENGSIFVLSYDDSYYPGGRDLTKEQQQDIWSALWELYTKDKPNYELFMRFSPSFLAISGREMANATGQRGSAYVFFDSLTIYINKSIRWWDAKFLASLLVHEVNHWVVGDRGLDRETEPTKQEIACMIRLGEDPNTIQKYINEYMSLPYYKNGARQGQALLDIELARLQGKAFADSCILPINSDFHVTLGQILRETEA